MGPKVLASAAGAGGGTLASTIAKVEMEDFGFDGSRTPVLGPVNVVPKAATHLSANSSATKDQRQARCMMPAAAGPSLTKLKEEQGQMEKMEALALELERHKEERMKMEHRVAVARARAADT